MFANCYTLCNLLTLLYVWCWQVADITFNFWNRLSELLYEEIKEKKTDVEEKRLDVSKSDRLLLFKPYIARLIIALCRLCQYDPHTVWLVSLASSLSAASL